MIKEKESEIALKNAQTKNIEKALNDRITALEDKFEKMVEKLEKTRNENESLRKTIHTLEIKLVNKEKDNKIGSPGQDDDCEEIEANCGKEIDWSDDTIEEAEAVLEATGNQPNIENLYRCKTCYFIGKTEAGLKIHVTTKHKEK
jgi:BMFP domain-containing protein YqiC